MTAEGFGVDQEGSTTSSRALIPRRHYGNAAHFIGSESCSFHLATQIGDFIISTVGDYKPDPKKERQTIGYTRFLETMVFKVRGPCTCGCGMPEHDGSDIDFAGYQERDEANAGHEAMCRKYESPESASVVLVVDPSRSTPHQDVE